MLLDLKMVQQSYDMNKKFTLILEIWKMLNISKTWGMKIQGLNNNLKYYY